MTSRAPIISIRLTPTELEQLRARAYTVSGSVAGVTRELVRAGLAGGDAKAVAERLLQVERRLSAIEQQGRESDARIQAAERAARDLLTMFDRLLKTLSG